MVTTCASAMACSVFDTERMLDLVVDLRAAAHAGGVDQRELAAVALERHEDAVARGAGDLARDQALVADAGD